MPQTNFTISKLQQLLKSIPRGKVTTYAELARALGSARASRAAGTLCGRNPEPDKYPCYKVVRSDGSIGKYGLGTAEKIHRLKADGIAIQNNKIPELKKYLFTFAKK